MMVTSAKMVLTRSTVALGVILLAVAGGCLPPGRKSEVHTEIVTQKVDRAALREPHTREDSLDRAAALRADSAGALVDTIVASPATLHLRVGDSLPFFEALHLEGRDVAGHPVPEYAPVLFIPRSRAATLRHASIVALAPGNAMLFIRPVRFPPLPPASMRRPLTRVEVIVEER